MRVRIPRRDAPEFCKTMSLDDRGRRECRVPAAPAASRAKLNKAHERSHHRFRRINRHSPRNGFNAYTVLSPATNSSCHRHLRIKGLSKARSGRRASADLTPATGARTTRLRRPQQASFVCVPFVSSRALFDPPCHPLTSPDAAASTASRPAFVTTRDPPLLSRRDIEGYAAGLGQAETEIFFKMGVDSRFGKTRTDLPVGQNQYR